MERLDVNAVMITPVPSLVVIHASIDVVGRRKAELERRLHLMVPYGRSQVSPLVGAKKKKVSCLTAGARMNHRRNVVEKQRARARRRRPSNM